MNDSHIVVKNNRCTTFVGGDAVNYVRAEFLASALKLYHDSKGRIIPTRGVTAMKMLKMATEYSGKNYKRGDYLQASADVKKWADEMKAALPKVEC